jgi:hypothetical protein
LAGQFGAAFCPELGVLPTGRFNARQRWAKCFGELLEWWDYGIRIAEVDSHDAKHPGGHLDFLNHKRYQSALAFTHIQNFAEDGFLLAMTALQIMR